MMHSAVRYTSSQIGILVRTALLKNKVKHVHLAQVLHNHHDFKIKKDAFCTELTYLIEGNLYGRGKHNARDSSYQQMHLLRLAHILYTGGIKEDHEVIQALRSINPQFKYPPENGISYDILLKIFPPKSSQEERDRWNLCRRTKRKLIRLSYANYEKVSDYISELLVQQSQEQNKVIRKIHTQRDETSEKMFSLENRVAHAPAEVKP